MLKYFKMDSIFILEVVFIWGYIYRVLGLVGIVSNNQVSKREVQIITKKRNVVQVVVCFVEGGCAGHYSVVSFRGAWVLGIGT